MPVDEHESPGSRQRGRPTRRHLLRVVTAGTTIGLAGCSLLGDRANDGGGGDQGDDQNGGGDDGGNDGGDGESGDGDGESSDGDGESGDGDGEDQRDEREFVATGRVGLSEDGVRELAVGQPIYEEVAYTYVGSADGGEVVATVRSTFATYGVHAPARISDWSVADPRTVGVGVLSTPVAVAGGEQLNPLVETPLADLLERDEGRSLLGGVGVGAGGGSGSGSGRGEPPEYVRTPERVGSLDTVSILGASTTFESYAGVAAGVDGADESFLVHGARVRVDGDGDGDGSAVLVVVVQRRQVAGDADEPALFDEDFDLYDDPKISRLLRLAEQRIVLQPPLKLELWNVTASSDGFSRGPGRFSPHGFNYVPVRTLENGVAWHDTFNPARYDPSTVQSDLSLIASHGYTLLRVFIDNVHGPGVIDRPGDTEFSPAYLANVVDFLHRARANDIVVILCFPRFPPRADHPPNPSEPIEGRNRAFLYRPFIDYKAAYLRDFVRALFDREPALEETVFAVELENESRVHLDVGPFTERSGEVTTAAGTYDRSSDAELQRMIDDNTAVWANTCVAAVRDAAPDTLVSTNVYTYLVRGVSGPGDFDPSGGYVDVPMNPHALAETDVDYLDLHVYAAPPGTPAEELDSIDFPALKSTLDRLDKPLLLGEFGAFKEHQPGLDAAATDLRGQWDDFDDRGFHGFAHWPFDAADHPRMYGATDGPGDGTILERLADP